MLKTYHFVGLSFLLIVTDVVRCDYVLNFEAGGWFKLYLEPKAWTDAFLKCYNDGAVLASPLNNEIAKALHSKLAQSGVNSDIFLGIHDFYSKGDFVSVEGVPLSDMVIRWGSHHNGTVTGDCLTMTVDSSMYYSSCKNPLPFVCYRKIMKECGTEYHFNQHTGSCYKIHLDRQTWTRAYSICASEGGHLVILNDEEEARIVKDMFPASTHTSDPWDGFHVGLGAWGKERIWTTIHGERIEDVYNKWYLGEPNNKYGEQDRGLLLWSGTLDDIREDEAPRPFACEKSRKPKSEDALINIFPVCTKVSCVTNV